MSAINEISSLWMEGAMRTLDAFRTGFGATMDDPPPTTASRVIYESGLVRLRHYEARGTAHRTPLLLIYSLIKRPFILDLQPGRSVCLVRQPKSSSPRYSIRARITDGKGISSGQAAPPS